jgi:transposase
MQFPENITDYKAAYQALLEQNKELSGQNKAILEKLEESLNANRELAGRLELLMRQYSELQRQLFGSKSERRVPQFENQPTLFDLEEPKQPEPQTEEVSYTRHKKEKKQPVRSSLPAHLPRKTEVIEPADIPEDAVKIGEEVTEVLEYTPSEVYVRRIVRPKYASPRTDAEAQISIASLPSLPIEKGSAGASLLAYLIASKYVDHLPFYRLNKILARSGIKIPEPTIGGWVKKCCRWMDLLYESMCKKLLTQTYLMADETGVPVLTQDKPGATHKGYFWVYYSPELKLVMFDYREGRDQSGPNEVLKSFKGDLQVDGYAGYNEVFRRSDVHALGCMAHARRKFERAEKSGDPRATTALKYFSALYAIERAAREGEYSAGERYALRQEEAVPRLKELEKWLKKEAETTLPRSAMGEAISYTLNFWSRLLRYVQDGRFEIDNNLIENSIRPVALGRKNYMFAGSHEGAKRAAIIYTLMGTCKMRGIDPFKWLHEYLTKVPDWPANRIAELEPGAVTN